MAPLPERICSWRIIACVVVVVLFRLALTPAGAAAEPAFALRGYYLTFMRMPAMGLAEWKQAVDCFAEDDVNLLVLWMPGGFRSRKFPLTWRYNEQHPNVRHDFVRELIDYAHTKRIRVLLGFTPFGYDGVNQMPRDHPDWKAKKGDGSPVDEFGIHSWGWSLCPAHPETQRFMREYLREMIFEFYPNADGLMVESSDYNVCQCGDCRARPYEEEFTLAKEISVELWRARPDALILVYPHYFTGKKVPGLEVAAARQQFDSRWGLVFTPHSAHFDADLIKRAKFTVFSGPEAALGTPAAIANAARTAQSQKVNGYLPSFEAFSYVATRAEGGEPYFVGRRRRPLGLDPENEGKMPYDQLLPKVQRFAVREFGRQPDLSTAAFQQRLADFFFPNENDSAQTVVDLLELQSIWNFDSDWYWSSPLLNPAFFRERAKRLHWPAAKLQIYEQHLDRLREMTRRYARSSNSTKAEMARVSGDIVKAWGDDSPLRTVNR
jgi:hypothetical protein